MKMRTRVGYAVSHVAITFLTLLCLVAWSGGPVVCEAAESGALEVTLLGLSAKSVEERVAAVRALGAFKDERVVDALIAACKDSDRMIRRFALQSLRSIGSPRGLSAAKECLDDRYSVVRDEAAKTVSALAAKPETEWASIYRAVQDPRAKSTALRSLAEIDARAVAQEIRVAAEQKDSFMRAVGIYGLTVLNEREDIDALKKLATNEESSVRLEVACVCGRVKNAETAVEIMGLLIHDKDQAVRWRCLNDLAGINSTNTWPLYLEAIRKENVARLRVDAAQSVRKTQNAIASLESLRSLLAQEHDESVRDALKDTIQVIEAKVVSVAAEVRGGSQESESGGSDAGGGSKRLSQ